MLITVTGLNGSLVTAVWFSENSWRDSPQGREVSFSWEFGRPALQTEHGTLRFGPNEAARMSKLSHDAQWDRIHGALNRRYRSGATAFEKMGQARITLTAAELGFSN